MDAALQALTSRLQQAGIDPATPLEYGAAPLAEHASRLGQPLEPWLTPLAEFVEALHARGLSLWSPLRFSVSSLAGVAGERPEHLGPLLRALSQLLLTLADRGMDRTRTEQYGVRAAATALVKAEGPFLSVLTMATRLVEKGHDPGWMLQGIVPPLWEVAQRDASVFQGLLGTLEQTALRLGELGVSPGYPFSVGAAALCAYGTVTQAHFRTWLERMVRMARSPPSRRASPPLECLRPSRSRWPVSWRGPASSLVEEDLLRIEALAAQRGDELRQRPAQGAEPPRVAAAQAEQRGDGGMHLLIVEEDGKRYLTLPGINPSVRLLARVEASVFLDAVVDYGWRLAHKLGLQGVWVPASPAIHSNRRAIHEELERRGRTLRGGQVHEFSTEPFSYSFDQVLEAPEQYLPGIPAP